MNNGDVDADHLKHLENVKVVHHDMDGWMKPDTDAQGYYYLPKQAWEYIQFIEQFVSVKSVELSLSGTDIRIGQIDWKHPSRDSTVKRAWIE
ncbi:hypothetical protein CEP51_007436 [Fusarium floridanum]|uniref:Uncharacterized protein n=1 Tax=Fusarium floridanum TaxID=1325733 RepID=A0A428RP91_9HYPO|nr:hypothetical protein CEP51_007436 [Fusarium floridanum]